MRIVLKALLVAAVAGTGFLAPAAHADDCHDVGPVTNCTYVNGTCVQGGGRIGDRTLYYYHGPTC